MSPEVRAALTELVAALEGGRDANLGKVVVVDFEAKRYTGGIISGETREVLAELTLRLNQY